MLGFNSDEVIPKELMREFSKRLLAVLGDGRAIDRSLAHDLEDAIRTEITHIRKAGFRFPDLRVVYFESVGWIEIVRADLEPESIERIVQNVIQRFPNIEVHQLVTSIHRAFPMYHRDDAGAEGLRVKLAVEDKLRGQR